MSDDSYSFSTARARLDEIVTQVRKKDTSLEKSLDLLEEGVRLANACTELIDHADWTVGGIEGAVPEGEAAAADDGPADADDAPSAAEEDATAETEQGADEDAASAESDDETFAPDDDAFGDAADEAWADGTPDYRDDEA